MSENTSQQATYKVLVFWITDEDGLDYQEVEAELHLYAAQGYKVIAVTPLQGLVTKNEEVLGTGTQQIVYTLELVEAQG